VPDLEPAIAFYTAALGLKLGRRLDDDVAELTGGSSLLYLLQKPARTYTRHWTPVHIDIEVDDVQAAARRALAAGARQESACVEWRGSKCITFADPFGHGFCLIQFTGGTYTEA
jgi:catechol 2,3-dioxygenase-like lactoylglutathione lyase family enzyme